MSGFSGSGWAFPVQRAADGTIARSADPDGAVEDAIAMILGTAPGERVMQPDYGTPVGDYVFAPVNAGTTGQVSQAVQAALAEWEPRIDVLDVTTTADPGDPRRLLVAITYQVRSTNSRNNLVYPFYLE
ncbi:MAG TPA: GPW/gp25 family protein [Trebonia sp.]|nr:GPW/gp25 family protein [Trebonia sp.]